MNDKQYFTKLNGYWVKDSAAHEHLKGIVKFHAISGSSATYIAEFPNGKNMIIDTGLSTQWDAIKSAIDSLGITKFDYAVISHFHSDHYGNIQNLIDEYDFSECNWYIQMRPDYLHYSSYILDDESKYNEQLNLLESNGITPIIPTNNQYITVDADNDIKIRFLNTDATIAQNYYTRYSESGAQGTTFNNFSLITEITHKNVKILSTGDIERPVEDQYASYLGKVNVITAPHHSVNRDANRAFYYGTMPDYALIMLPSVSAQPTYRQLEYYKEIGTKVIASYSSVAVNGLYSFTSDGYTIVTNALYSGYTDSIFNYSLPLVHMGSLYEVTSYDETTISLNQILANMPKGSQLIQRWDVSYTTNHPTLYNDILTLFPLFNENMTIMLRALYVGYEVRVYNDELEFIATSPSTISWSKKGNGLYGTNITTQSDLLTFISKLPKGNYSFNYFKDTNGDSGVLDTGGGYALSVNKTSNTSGLITGVLKTNATGSDKARCVFGYMSSLNSTPAIQWHQVNN